MTSTRPRGDAAVRGAGRAPPAPAHSGLRASASTRVAFAGVLLAVMWAAVGWALA